MTNIVLQFIQDSPLLVCLLLTALTITLSFFSIGNGMADSEKNAKKTRAKIIARDEVYKHNTLNDLWMIINNKVYDFTSFANSHPGGQNALMKHAGGDATLGFIGIQHKPQTVFPNLSKHHLGNLPPAQRAKFYLKKDKDEVLSKNQNNEVFWIAVRSGDVHNSEERIYNVKHLVQSQKLEEVQEIAGRELKLEPHFVGYFVDTLPLEQLEELEILAKKKLEIATVSSAAGFLDDDLGFIPKKVNAKVSTGDKQPKPVDKSTKNDEEEEKDEPTKKFSRKQVAKHSSEFDAHVIVNGDVLRLTDFVDVHPGGTELLKPLLGQDITNQFHNAKHPEHVKDLLRLLKIGEVLD